MRNFNLDKFVRGYMAAALRSSTDEDGEPLDTLRDVTDIAPECVAAMRESCTDFAKSNHADLQAYGVFRPTGEAYTWEECAGHDFWLTRNGHGVGFWDRGMGALGERLSDAAKVYGAVDLYVGDDGKVYGE